MSGAQQRADKAREDAAIWEALANEQIEAQRETAKAAALRSATLEEQNKKLIAELTALQAAAQALPPKQLALAIQQASDASEAIELDEAATRKLIDRQLHDAGWQVDSQRLTFERGVRPTKGKNLAIAEWPTLAEGKDGWADYVLFAGLQVLAVVEAKRKHKDVVGVIPQAKRYSFGYVVKGDEHLPEGSPWGQHKVPFLFATNGRPFLRQLRTKSGIWFLDARRSENHPVPLEGWYTPEGLLDLLKQDIDDAHARLKVEPMPYVDREYQKNAILAVERGLEQGKRELRTPRRASQKFRLWTSTTASSWTSATAGTCSTATPALHTKEIFGAPVFSYSYREAAEGRTRRSDARAASGAKWRRPREWREQRPRQFPETEEGKGHTRSGSLVVL